MDAFERAAGRLGIRLPGSARTFYRKPPKLKNLVPASIQDLAKLRHLYPAAPARYLPLFSISNGDLLGLYFARGHAPLVAGFDHEQSNLIPVSKNVDGLFKNPDAYCFNDPANPNRCFLRRNAVWGSLQVRPKARMPELELLKPLAVQYEALKGLDPSIFRALIKNAAAKKDPARLIRETFRDVKSLHDRKRWFQLSDELARAGNRLGAIQALENCHVLHFIYPSYGEPYAKDAKPEWAKVLEVFERLQPLVEKDGDELDRVTTRHKIRIARGWARDE
jgi:hypothetical protein